MTRSLSLSSMHRRHSPALRSTMVRSAPSDRCAGGHYRRSQLASTQICQGVGPIAEMESVSIIRTAARWWLDRVRHDRRVRPRRSARCEKRGVKSSQGFGVAKLGTDGPARRSSLLSPAWWTGPPPIPRRGPPRATNRMTRPPRRSPPQEAARGFWIRAWGQRGPALQGTGRSNDPARWLGLLEGGLDDSLPLTPKPTHFASNTRSGR